MPRGDGTGPLGLGPKTGRGLGFCAGFDTPGFIKAGFGRRYWGRIFGRGMGFRWRFWNPFTYDKPLLDKKEEKNLLKRALDELNKEKELIEKKLKKLEGEE